MSTKPNDGGPAFPWPVPTFDTTGSEIGHSTEQPGMSLRAYFAGQALPAVMAGQFEIARRGGNVNPPTVVNDVAQIAIEYADALLSELSKETP